MRVFLLLAFILTFPAAASAATRCYTLLEDPDVTVTDDTDDIYTLVMKAGNETTVMRTESGGTGTPFRQATEPNGKIHLSATKVICSLLISTSTIWAVRVGTLGSTTTVRAF